MTRSKKKTACQILYLSFSSRLPLSLSGLSPATGKTPDAGRKGAANEKDEVYPGGRSDGSPLRRWSCDGGSGGFTLVEMLLALTIFALVISILYAGFNAVMNPVNSVRSARDSHEAGRNAMMRIKWDLLSLCLTRNAVYIPSDRLASRDSDRFRFVCRTQPIGQSRNSFSHLRFASFEHLGFNRESDGAIGIIIYQVRPGQDNTLVLQRRDLASALYSPLDEETDSGTGPVLCERVKAFELKFMDREGNVHGEWDSDSSDFKFETPAAVIIRLETSDSSQSYVFETTVRLPVVRKNNEPAPL